MMKAYKDVGKLLSRYWCSYGGLQAVVTSPYLHVSLGLLIVTAHYWLTDTWWEQALAVAPSLLGFTLGGFAIFLGFGDEDFKHAIGGRDPKTGQESPYIDVCVAFLHFVVVQTLALVAAIVGNATAFYFDFGYSSLNQAVAWLAIFGHAIGYLLFLYSVALSLAAAAAVFKVATWYDRKVEIAKLAEEAAERAANDDPV